MQFNLFSQDIEKNHDKLIFFKYFSYFCYKKFFLKVKCSYLTTKEWKQKNLKEKSFLKEKSIDFKAR